MKLSFLLFTWISALFFSPALKADHQALTQQLVEGKYFGAFRLGYHAGEYLNDRFQLNFSTQDATKQSFTWVTKQGRYNQLTGYWIYRPNINQCWQAVKCDGPLVFWNADGHAKGNPEDWELFVIEYANDTHTEVCVRNIYGRYVRYAAPYFVCDANRSDAAAFVPEF